MDKVIHIRQNFQKMLPSFLGLIIFSYFLFHLVQGDRGYFSLQGMKLRQVEAQEILTDLQAKRQVLEHRVRLMRSESLDPDMLEERVRAVLNFSESDESIIMSVGFSPSK